MEEQAASIFSKIINREIPATIVYENEQVVAFKDVNPQAPCHILVVPRKPVRDILECDKALLGEVMHAAAEVARQQGIVEDGFRVVINTGAAAGQTVFHLHVHVIGGRELGWPPG